MRTATVTKEEKIRKENYRESYPSETLGSVSACGKLRVQRGEHGGQMGGAGAAGAYW